MKTIEQLEVLAHEAIVAVSNYQKGGDGYCVAQTAHFKGYEAGSWNMKSVITRCPYRELEYYKVVAIKYAHPHSLCISITWIVTTDAGKSVWTIDGTGAVVKRSEVVGWRRINP